MERPGDTSQRNHSALAVNAVNDPSSSTAFGSEPNTELGFGPFRSQSQTASDDLITSTPIHTRPRVSQRAILGLDHSVVDHPG